MAARAPLCLPLRCLFSIPFYRPCHIDHVTATLVHIYTATSPIHVTSFTLIRWHMFISPPRCYSLFTGLPVTLIAPTQRQRFGLIHTPLFLPIILVWASRKYYCHVHIHTDSNWDHRLVPFSSFIHDFDPTVSCPV